MNIRVLSCLLVLMTLLTTGCGALRSRLAGPEASAIAISIEDISADSQPGRYTVRGLANLPEQTRLAVSAVRPLASADPSLDTGDYRPYALLDREFVRVEEGRWQAQLELWQLDDNRQFRESWQFDAALTPKIEPDPTVQFSIAVEPDDFSNAIQAQLEATPQAEQEDFLRFTEEGSLYLQLFETAAVPLPDGSAPASLASVNEAFTWEGRSTVDSAAIGLAEDLSVPTLETDNLPLSEPQMLK